MFGHVDACVDRLNEGSWDPAMANTTAYLTGSVFTVSKLKLSRTSLGDSWKLLHFRAEIYLSN